MADRLRTRELAKLRTRRWRARVRASRERHEGARAKERTLSISVLSTSSSSSFLKNSTGSDSTVSGGGERDLDVWDQELSIPVWWLARLQGYRYPVMVTALVIWRWHILRQRSRSWMWIRAADVFAQCGMSRHSIRRALDKLTAVGLIRIFRRRGVWPRVMVIEREGMMSSPSPVQYQPLPELWETQIETQFKTGQYRAAVWPATLVVAQWIWDHYTHQQAASFRVNLWTLSQQRQLPKRRADPALDLLQAAGLIQIHRTGKGWTPRVTISGDDLGVT
jgi:hypothetical protein